MTTPCLRMIAKRSDIHAAVLLRCHTIQCSAFRRLSATASAHSYTPQPRSGSLTGWNNHTKTPPSSSSFKPAHQHATRADEDVWDSRSRRHPLQQSQQSRSNQIQQRWQQPPKYKSLIYFPNTNVSLKYPHSHAHDSINNNNKKFSLQCENFAIAKPGDGGGHVLLGRNGVGKSLLVKYLTNPEQLLLDQRVDYDNYNDDNDGDWKLLHPSQVAHVSFDSHLQILIQQPHLRVHDAITSGIGSGNLNKVAQYLIVRFGLKSLLHRTISTLSTGEIRKCLIVAALAHQPQLLILENAFDGLDINSRNELKSIVCKTMQGLNKSGKLLVTSVSAESVATTPVQVFLCTHRPEEIVDAVDTISMILPVPTQKHDDDISNNNNSSNYKLVTIQRPIGWSQEQIMNMALGLDKDYNKNKSFKILAPWQVVDESLPTIQELQKFWNHHHHHDQKDDNNSNNNNDAGGGGQTVATNSNNDKSHCRPLMTLDKVEIRRRRDGMTADDDDEKGKGKHGNEFVTLLQPLSWEIASGQRWLIAGGNGAGKSTLSRFLLHSQNEPQVVAKIDCNDDDVDTTCDFTSGTYSKDPKTTIGWVSTESHLSQMTEAAKNDDNDNELSSNPVTRTAWDVITHNGTASKLDNDMNQLVSWIFGSGADAALLKTCPFQELSQGQQKLVLFASAVATRPKVLIMDEPTQGLDWLYRCRVLAFLERLCQATDTSLAFITHYQEEWIPSISHVLHLHQGRVVYQGPKHGYNPAKLNNKLNEDDEDEDMVADI